MDSSPLLAEKWGGQMIRWPPISKSGGASGPLAPPFPTPLMCQQMKKITKTSFSLTLCVIEADKSLKVRHPNLKEITHISKLERRRLQRNSGVGNGGARGPLAPPLFEMGGQRIIWPSHFSANRGKGPLISKSEL